MSKRKLTRKQQWRIQKVQEERQKRALKKDQQLTAKLNDFNLSDEFQNGTLIANFGSEAEIESDQGERFRCLIRANLPSLVVGDRIVWQQAKQGLGVISAMNPRKSELSRPDERGDLKPVAANIDQLLIVFAPAPNYSELLIDQYLAAAELTGINAIIVLNKIDLIEQSQTSEFHQLVQCYQNLNYRIIQTTIHQQKSIELLFETLTDKCSVFVGQSGVGKSSLVKQIIGDHSIITNPLSEKSGLGQHTTSTSRLYHLQPSGTLIDSPGVREFRIWNMERNQLLQGFREFRNCLGKCRFRNCQHINEPECALLEALEEGKINPNRMKNYQRIAESICNTEK